MRSQWQSENVPTPASGSYGHYDYSFQMEAKPHLGPGHQFIQMGWGVGKGKKPGWGFHFQAQILYDSLALSITPSSEFLFTNSEFVIFACVCPSFYHC